MIVINYRRADSSGYALYLYSELAKAFSKQRVFLDVGGELSGHGDFEKVIFKKIEQCRVFICLIGANWLTVSNARGPRLQDPDDLVRREIDAALRSTKIVIPILLNGAPMPDRLSLPNCISEIPRLDALTFRHERFEADAQNIVAVIRKSLQIRQGQPPANAPKEMTMYSPEALSGLENLVKSLAQQNLSSPLTPRSNALASLNYLNALDSSQNQGNALANLRPKGPFFSD